MTKTTLLVGARDSQLSLIQARTALQRIEAQTGLHFELRPFSSPGDSTSWALVFAAGAGLTHGSAHAAIRLACSRQGSSFP